MGSRKWQKLPAMDFLGKTSQTIAFVSATLLNWSSGQVGWEWKFKRLAVMGEIDDFN